LRVRRTGSNRTPVRERGTTSSEHLKLSGGDENKGRGYDKIELRRKVEMRGDMTRRKRKRNQENRGDPPAAQGQSESLYLNRCVPTANGVGASGKNCRGGM